MSVTSYIYLQIPFERKPPVFNQFAPWSVYQAVENDLFTRQVPSDRKDLIDMVRVYRVKRQYQIKLRNDLNGSYVNLPKYGIFRFDDTDPTKRMPTMQDFWMPAY